MWFSKPVKRNKIRFEHSSQNLFSFYGTKFINNAYAGVCTFYIHFKVVWLFCAAPRWWKIDGLVKVTCTCSTHSKASSLFSFERHCTFSLCLHDCLMCNLFKRKIYLHYFCNNSGNYCLNKLPIHRYIYIFFFPNSWNSKLLGRWRKQTELACKICL